MNEINEKFYSVSEAAKILNVHPYTVRRNLADKKLAHYRFDKTIKIGESQLRDYVAQAKVKAAEEKSGVE